MIIGVDFDNTIVCYDRLFHQICRERNLIPDTVPVNKSDVRNYLRQIGKEELWTELQGYVYGARMSEAEPYPGVFEFFQRCRHRGLDVRIISHKTRFPITGERYDLHDAARAWLEQFGFFDPNRLGLSADHVFFELTREAKLKRVAASQSRWFIDDLPEFLSEPGFPNSVRRVLFDPNDLYPDQADWIRIRHWTEANGIVC